MSRAQRAASGGSRIGGLAALVALVVAPDARGSDDCPRFPPFETSPGAGHSVLVPADLDGDGDLDLASPAGFLVNQGDGRFVRLAAPFTGELRGLAVADLDGDGDPDLAVTNFLGDSVEVWSNQGNLAFAGLGAVPAGDGAWGVDAGDVDGDGDRDVVVASHIAASVRILHNQGGGFLAVGPVLPVGMSTRDVALGDLDLDGDQDLLVTGENPSAVLTFRNDGLGTFTQVAGVGISNNWPNAIELARLDADADLDAVVTLANGNSVLAFSNPGNGLMTNFAVLATGGRTLGVAVGDLDQDGDLDVVAATGKDLGGHAVFRNAGNGTFAPAEERPCLAAQGVALGRFDLDAHVDLVVSTGTGGAARCYTFAGSATGPAFAPAFVQIAASGSVEPRSIASADADGDGDLDLFAGVDLVGARYLRNDGPAGYASQTLPNPGFGAGILRAGDLDGDGDPDLVAGSVCSGCGVFLLWNTGGAFVLGPTLPLTALVGDLLLDDMDGDGDLDIAALSANTPPPPPFPPFPDNVVTFRNDGTGAFTAWQTIGTGTRSSSIASGDFDGDGRRDLAVACLTGPALWVYLRLSNGNLAAPTQPSAPTNARTVRAADLDGDLDVDLALGIAGVSPQIAVLLNGGAGTFALLIGIPGAAGSFGTPGSLDAGDLDGDGDSDLVVTGYDGVLQVVESLGGTFAARAQPSAVVARIVVVADTNQDGRMDLVVGYGGSQAGIGLGAGLALLEQLPPCGTGTAFCFGDGTGTACPCGNASPVGAGAGCLNSLGVGATLAATGTPSLAADTVVLQAISMPANTSALFVQGSATDGAGLGTPLADGLRCVLGTIVRLGTRPASGGSAGYGAPLGDVAVSMRGGVTQPGTTVFYQGFYRNAVAFCTPATSNLTNGFAVIWRP